MPFHADRDLLALAVNEGTIDQVIGEARDIAEVAGASAPTARADFRARRRLTALWPPAGREVPRIEARHQRGPPRSRATRSPAQQALTVNAGVRGPSLPGHRPRDQVVIEAMMGLSYDKPGFRRPGGTTCTVLMPLLHDGKVSYDGDAHRCRAADHGHRRHAPPLAAVVAARPQLLVALAGSPHRFGRLHTGA